MKLLTRENVITLLLALVTVMSALSTYKVYKIDKILSAAEINGAPAMPSVPKVKEVKKPSDYKFGKEYNAALKDKKPMVLLFYADWCHFCIDFMPKYEKLYKHFKNKYNFVKVNVEDEKYAGAVEKYQIQGFPTVFLVNPKTDKHEVLRNENFGNKKKMFDDLENFYKNNR